MNRQTLTGSSACGHTPSEIRDLFFWALTQEAYLSDVPADSLWHRWLPIIGNFDIPKRVFWEFLGDILSGFLIATFVYFLARRRFRSQRWWEIQEGAYTTLVDELFKYKEITHKLSLHEVEIA